MSLKITIKRDLESANATTSIEIIPWKKCIIGGVILTAIGIIAWITVFYQNEILGEQPYGSELSGCLIGLGALVGGLGVLTMLIGVCHWLLQEPKKASIETEETVSKVDTPRLTQLSVPKQSSLADPLKPSH